MWAVTDRPYSTMKIMSSGLRRFVLLSFFLSFLPHVLLAEGSDQLYRRGIEALYNLDFETAEKDFRELIKIEPQNPNRWNQLASALWSKIAAKQEKLSLESFSGASIGTDDSSDLVDPREEKELRDTLNTAISKADAILAANPKDVSALYAKGASKALLAAFEAVVKRSLLAAHSNARAARTLHSQVLELDPDFKDAALSIGVYDYAIASIPSWVRLVIGMFGVHGDKDAGISMIADAAKNGATVSTDAKILLVVIYNREKRYNDSLAVLSELHARYPRNYLLELSKASVYSRLHDYNNAVSTYSAVLKKIESGEKGYEHVQAPKILLLLAKAHLDNSAVAEAIMTYERLTLDGRATDQDRANTRLWLGKIYDIMKERTKALVQYDAIPSLNCSPRIKQEAQKYKKKPFLS